MMYDEKKFDLRAAFEPKGDQPKAIAQLLDGFKRGMDKQVLLGVTGSGKTFTISHVINNLNKPTLVLAHNKTLAAQLYHEFKDLFPKNRVEYFVSYYDYYQPESYIPSKDMYVPKDAQVNPKIEQMRVSATEALLTRRDVIVVSSVSCIYSLGDPSMYKKLSFELRSGMKVSRKQLIVVLLEQQYERNDLEPAPGNFRVRGDVIDVIPSYRDDMLRIELFGDEIERMSIIDRYNMEEKEAVDVFRLFPAKHFAIDEDSKERAIESINRELKEVLPTIDDPIIA
ncbi:MAG TPA: DEAD/DEAH box helicase family protein, partial [Candidatus Methanofastidiosa archaeon]|nr:DEAD/DEAH box helicase family protein [Candidatus Methanofastidiosa archaeon]